MLSYSPFTVASGTLNKTFTRCYNLYDLFFYSYKIISFYLEMTKYISNRNEIYIIQKKVNIAQFQTFHSTSRPLCKINIIFLKESDIILWLSLQLCTSKNRIFFMLIICIVNYEITKYMYKSDILFCIQIIISYFLSNR